MNFLKSHKNVIDLAVVFFQYFYLESALTVTVFSKL